jgi:hypothetical protein
VVASYLETHATPQGIAGVACEGLEPEPGLAPGTAR